MTVYIDDSQLSWRGRNWCHLVADSVAELHAFAAKLGLRKEWFQDRTMYPHYDVTMSIQRRALALGARVGDKKTIVACAKRLRTELSQDLLADGAEVLPQRATGCGGAMSSDVSVQRSLFGD